MAKKSMAIFFMKQGFGTHGSMTAWNSEKKTFRIVIKNASENEPTMTLYATASHLIKCASSAISVRVYNTESHTTQCLVLYWHL